MINLYKIGASHQILFKEINEEFNPNENSDTSKFIEYLMNIPTNQEIYVLKNEDEIIGCGTLLIEKKMIHNYGKVAHIEDIFIRKEFRKKNYGNILINHLNNIAKNKGCYKIILDCKKELEEFYEKCGYTSKNNIQMSIYF